MVEVDDNERSTGCDQTLGEPPTRTGIEFSAEGEHATSIEVVRRHIKEVHRHEPPPLPCALERPGASLSMGVKKSPFLFAAGIVRDDLSDPDVSVSLSIYRSASLVEGPSSINQPIG
jgi:hypothetical protein